MIKDHKKGRKKHSWSFKVLHQYKETPFYPEIDRHKRLGYSVRYRDYDGHERNETI